MNNNFVEFPQLEKGAWQVDPAEFKEAVMLVTRVYSGEDEFEPGHYQVRYFDENGAEQTVELANTPLNRILLALREWYHEEPVEKYISVSWRIFSLSKLIRTGALKEWIQYEKDGEELYMPGFVTYAAATLPLNQVEGFDQDMFLSAVRVFQNAGKDIK